MFAKVPDLIGVEMFQKTVPGNIVQAVSAIVKEPGLRLELNSLGTADERIHSAIEGGVDQWEAAWGGVGGSPFAQNPAANMDIRSLVRVYRQRGLDHGLNMEEIYQVIDFLREQTNRHIIDIEM